MKEKTAGQAAAELVGIQIPDIPPLEPIPDYQSGMSDECKAWVEEMKKTKAEAEMSQQEREKTWAEFLEETKKEIFDCATPSLDQAIEEEEQAGGRMKELVDRMKCEANFKARLKRIYLSKKQK